MIPNQVSRHSDLSNKFYFKRQRPSISNLEQSKVSIQRKMKRLLKSSNLIVFDKQSVDIDADIRLHFNSISKLQEGRLSGAMGNANAVVGIWQTPTRDRNSARELVRVFKRVGSKKGNVVDFIDNSGRYSSSTTSTSKYRPVVTTGFGRNCAAEVGPSIPLKDTHQNNVAVDDEVFPLYGESDNEMYDSDFEWERDMREAERAKSKGPRVQSSKKQAPQASSTDNSDEQDVDLDIFMDVDNDAIAGSSTQHPNQKIPTLISRSSQESLSPQSLSSAVLTTETTTTTTPPSSSLIHEAILSQIEIQESLWTTTVLPKILHKSHKIYRSRNSLELKYKAELFDLVSRRIPKLISGIVDSAMGNVRAAERACKNLRPSIYRKKELEWKVEIVESVNPPDESVGPRPKKRTRVVVEGAAANGEQDDEHWSDFIASEDDDDINEDEGELKKAPSGPHTSNGDFEEDEVMEEGSSVQSQRSHGKNTTSSVPFLNTIPSLLLDSESANEGDDMDTSTTTTATTPKLPLPPQQPPKTSTPVVDKKIKQAAEFHQNYLRVLKAIETESSNLNIPGQCTFEEFRLIQEYSIFLIHADMSIYNQRKENCSGTLNDFETMSRWDMALEFLEWKETTTAAAETAEAASPATAATPPSRAELKPAAATAPAAGHRQLKDKRKGEDEDPVSDFSDVDEPVSKKVAVDKLVATNSDSVGGGGGGGGSSSSRSGGGGEKEVDESTEIPSSRVKNRIKSRMKKKARKQSYTSSDSESGSDDDESMTEVDLSDNDTRPGKGRKELRPITEESESVSLIRANRKKQEDDIQRRAKKQMRLINKTKRRGERVKVIINLGHDDNEQPIYVDDFLARHLKPHQISGIQFLWRSIIMIKENEDEGTGHQGCILAHAMGLGKTLQTITFVYTLQREVRANNPCIPEHLKEGGILVVCPAIVVDNWANEINKWISPKKRDEVLGGIFSFGDGERINQLETWNKKGGVFIISYQLLRYALTSKRDEVLPDTGPSTPEHVDGALATEPKPLGDAEKYYRYLISPGPAFVVCDESHVIKNPKSGVSNFLSNVRTRSRLCLTGYPLQNNLEEYHAMIDFVSPGFLGSLPEFRNQYQNPITNGFFADSTASDKVVSRQRLFVLVKIIEPLICRMNDDILKGDLPEKNEYIISVRLTPVQYRLYLKYLEYVKSQDVGKGVISKFNSMQTILNHPFAFKASVDTSKVIDDSQEGLESSGINRARKAIIATEGDLDWQDSTLSAKLLLVEEIVNLSTKIGDKVLIFSRSIPTIELLKAKLEKNFKIQVLTGKTTQNSRQKLIDDFNHGSNNYDAFIISTVAGGIGVNLAAANRVVIFDHGWNPSHENQAISRAYRYGQVKSVFVYRLLTYGAFEEKLFMNSVHKITLATQVVDNKNIEKTANKTQMRQYFTAPPENPESELVTTKHYQDSIVESIVHNNPMLSKSIIKIESHEDFIRETEDDLTEGQKEIALDALERERYRRKNKLPFVESAKTDNLAAQNTAAEACVSGSAVDASVDSVENIIGGSRSHESTVAEEALPEMARLLDQVVDVENQALGRNLQEDVEDDTFLTLLEEGFDY